MFEGVHNWCKNIFLSKLIYVWRCYGDAKEVKDIWEIPWENVKFEHKLLYWI